MASDVTPQQVELVDSAVRILREHFSDVQVLVTWLDDNNGNTKSIARGSGNVFARMGMAREFLCKDVAQINAAEIRKQHD